MQSVAVVQVRVDGCLDKLAAEIERSWIMITIAKIVKIN